MSSHTYTGFLHRTETGISGTLVDCWGWTVLIKGVPGERDGVRGYVLTASVGETPEALRLAGENSMREPIDETENHA